MKKPTAALVFLILLGAFVALLTPRLAHVHQLRSRSDKLEQEIIALNKQNRRLEMELRLLREDPVYLEKVAREKFRKAKEGEIVYKVVREGEAAPAR